MVLVGTSSWKSEKADYRVQFHGIDAISLVIVSFVEIHVVTNILCRINCVTIIIVISWDIFEWKHGLNKVGESLLSCIKERESQTWQFHRLKLLDCEIVSGLKRISGQLVDSFKIL